MDIREKLADLIEESRVSYGENGVCINGSRDIADHLIANGVTIQEWVSVKDRLPTESCTYLVACSDGRVGWSFYNSTFPDRVTHWMPLPQPPKE